MCWTIDATNPRAVFWDKVRFYLIAGAVVLLLVWACNTGSDTYSGLPEDDGLRAED
jgi:hypothetical protein